MTMIYDELKNGGPAFPLNDPLIGAGMTLRDYFAARAMSAIIIGAMADGTKFNPESSSPVVARVAYNIADAMLKERSK